MFKFNYNYYIFNDVKINNNLIYIFDKFINV